MLSLPDCLYLVILDFLDFPDRYRCTCVCSFWYQRYMKTDIRKVTIHTNKWEIAVDGKCQIDVKRLCIVRDLVKNQVEQIQVKLPWGTDVTSLTTSLLAEFAGIEVLNCSLIQLYSLIRYGISHNIKGIALENRVWFDKDKPNLLNYETSLYYIQTNLSCLEFLSINFERISFPLPYIKSLKRLELSNNQHHASIPPEYSKQLKSLSMSYCAINDVTVLGQIAEVCMIQCNELVDISSLNENYSIIIDNCPKVQDFTKSFEFSTEITVKVSNSQAIFNMMRWKKVKVLHLEDSSFTSVSFTHPAYLPGTIKRCQLFNQFSVLININGSAGGIKLQQLCLYGNTSITTLDSLGIESIPLLECAYLPQLSSLKGLELYPHRRVVLRYCNRVKDFAPLATTNEVHIIDCDGFHPKSIQSFANTNIKHLKIVSPDFSVESGSSVKGFDSLDLSEVTILNSFEGLELVSDLRLRSDHLYILTKFLRNGGILRNLRLEIKLADLRATTLDFYTSSLKELYTMEVLQQHLEESFIFLQR